MKSVKCARCGLVNWVEAGECKRCGELLALLEEVRAGAADDADDFAPAAPVEETPRVCSFCGTEFRGFYCPLCRKHAREAPAPGPEVERSFVAALLPSWKRKAAAVLALVLAAAAARPQESAGRVWAVPVGGREFLEVKKVYPTSQGVHELSTVEFTWRWLPNDLGLDSEAVRAGKAVLRYDGLRWFVESVVFDDATPAADAADAGL